MNGGAPKVWGSRVDVLWPHVKVAVGSRSSITLLATQCTRTCYVVSD